MSARHYFRTRLFREGRPRRLKVLLALGWQRMGSYWISPRTGLRYTEQVAVDIEDLRGTFTNNYRKRWAEELAA
jgi:hypothetical protein